ncbi:MAG TPA: zf-HC2 domain-containing protein, partial [Verrucomicrobiae bacterium]|nr:zf-HC2 domain-containing protein [Verrucomicrobiae bacterium]
MNHPTREEWMSYLYDELTGEPHANLAAHLAVCPECKVKVAEWRGLKMDLNAWQIATKPARVVWNRPWLRWAAAAVVMLSAGFGAGRLSMSALADPEELRAAIEPSIRQQLRTEFVQILREELDKSSAATLAAANTQTKELVGDFAKAYEQNRVEGNQAVYVALNKLNAEHVAALAS